MSLSIWQKTRLLKMADRRLVDGLYAQMRLPIFVAPMFLVSGPDLVVAAAKAGVIGAFPAPNARTIDDMRLWLYRVSSELAAAGKSGLWAINMIVHKSYDRFDAELDLICEYRPRIVITALGSPKRPLDRVHAYGGVVFCDVANPAQARKAADAGADGLILLVSGAGGHTGKYSAFAFVEEVRRFWNGPLLLGGAIGSARGIAAALDLGADFAYMGTRFIATPESLVSDDNRAMIVRAEMSDIVTSQAITGVSANWLRESVELGGFTEEMLEAKGKVDFSNIQGDVKAWKNIWGAGHGVGNTTRIQTVAEIIDELAADMAALKTQSVLERWPGILN
jgi:nitronate monooxygenase